MASRPQLPGRSFWAGEILRRQTQHLHPVDLLLLVGLAGLAIGLVNFASPGVERAQTAIEIDLSLSALPHYTFYSLVRGSVAFLFSVLFTLVYGYWAAKDAAAERVLIPLLDILQSIPVLGFLPGLTLALITLIPQGNIGLELASILMIFTGQVWNLTFSFYHSLKSQPRDLVEMARLFQFSWWERFRWLELPYSMVGLVWNGMMSMAGGWFFLIITESFPLGDKMYRLPGLGAYMSVAVDKEEPTAIVGAIVAMIVMIVAIDQFFWRPLAVWAEKFRLEETSHFEVGRSWFLTLLRRSRLIRWLDLEISERFFRTKRHRRAALDSAVPASSDTVIAVLFSKLLLVLLLLLLGWGAWMLYGLIRDVSWSQWREQLLAGAFTLGRVLLAVGIGTLWTVPAGLALGLSPRWSRRLQPVIQIVASFPAPMLFTLVVLLLDRMGVSLGWGSIVLMLLGTQWYLLFNVIAGTMSLPGDLREAATSYRLTLWQRFKALYLPGIFPYLVTGWVTAAGGAWNASIVSEYVTAHGKVEQAFGLGAEISVAAAAADFPRLAAAVLVMAGVVLLFNRLVWRQCYNLAEKRFTLGG